MHMHMYKCLCVSVSLFSFVSIYFFNFLQIAFTWVHKYINCFLSLPFAQFPSHPSHCSTWFHRLSFFPLHVYAYNTYDGMSVPVFVHGSFTLFVTTSIAYICNICLRISSNIYSNVHIFCYNCFSLLFGILVRFFRRCFRLLFSICFLNVAISHTHTTSIWEYQRQKEKRWCVFYVLLLSNHHHPQHHPNIIRHLLENRSGFCFFLWNTRKLHFRWWWFLSIVYEYIHHIIWYFLHLQMHESNSFNF